MASPKMIETLSFIRGIRKQAETTGGKITLSEFQLQGLVRHVENIEAAVQMHAVANNSKKL
jgi:hypothetical protein